MRLLLILFVLFALSGCWVGPNLYTESDATPVIPAGKYRARDGAKWHIEEVSQLANGLTQIADDDGKAAYGFTPIDGEHRRYVVWSADTENSSDERPQSYMVLERRSDREFLVYLPNCEGKDAIVARLAGATVEKQTIVPECRFSTRASLEIAARRLKLDRPMIALERIGPE